ncbi:hypothetical protein LCGC14_0471710 [marine sediment metagenome]|uniref:Uncharacterized protein n=1 Tax=marine sediment metagenome TaxID=412755 RepID=A0A0F9SHB3_9ZZZZ|nr:MAG: hypothetical protein Lokiarch_25300 [Candidatus Lokiarchaeum sp. GC14_75]HEC37613.1 hypothetical protein [bacterium]
MNKTVKCKRCNRVLKAEGSIKLSYGKNCYRIMQLQKTQITSPNNMNLEELFNRIRKLELDNNFMKHQLKHRTNVSISNVETIERIKQDHHRPERNEVKVQFNVVVKELKVIFHERFDFHEFLKPIDGRTGPENPPVIIDLIEVMH